MLQKYVLWACQNQETGGFVDKPGKNVDYYHTSYAMSGLNLSFSCNVDNENGGSNEVHSLLGDNDSNTLVKIDPVYALSKSRLTNMKAYFEHLGPI